MARHEGAGTALTVRLHRRLRMAAACIAAAGLGACATPAPQDTTAPWAAVWGTAQMEPPAPAAGTGAPPPAWQQPFQGVSLRQVVRVSATGTELRVQVSNLLGRTPLVVSEAAVARVDKPTDAADPTRLPQPQAGSAQPLRFGGRSRLSLAAGAEIFSDPVPLSVSAGDEVLVDLHIVQGASPATAHPGSRIHSWAAQAGLPGASADTAGALPGQRWTAGVPALGWWHLAAIDVRPTAPLPVLVAVGDSITDGYGVPPGSYQRWTDVLQQRLAAAGRRAAVVNTGIGGNRLLADGAGPALVQRFERDVLQRSGVSHAVLLIGVNDFGVQRRNQQDTPEARARLLRELQQALRSLAQQAQQRGVCLMGATVLPYGGSDYYRPGPAHEGDRQALNAWIRDSGVFHAVIDFDALTREPSRPSLLRAAYDSGDGLHPSMAGYRAMAEAFPLDWLSTRCQR